LDRENHRPKHKPERPKRTKKDYKEVAQDSRNADRAAHHGDERKKERRSRRNVSGADMEEGRIKTGLRGGAGIAAGAEAWRWSDQSYEKEDFYRPPKKKKNKKKLCEYIK
jgi:hypothetical protein